MNWAGGRTRAVGGVFFHALLALLWAALVTYCSLLYEAEAVLVCSSFGDEITTCARLAAGFPFPFLVDHPGLSPAGSIAYDPLSLIVGVDLVLRPQLAATYGYWLLIAGLLAIKRYRIRRAGGSRRAML